MTDAYPQKTTERDRWILARRPAHNAVDPLRPHAFLVETERAESGEVVQVATIFLTNRECPWRCLMCDLWQNTLKETVPLGAIPAQIDYALKNLSAKSGPSARQLKLYNSGSFFDPRAIPPDDYPAIAERVRNFERVVVECHPALIGESVLKFQGLLQAAAGRKPPPTITLEVAMGLETVHPGVLPKLNKRMTLDQFRHAADLLRKHDVALRVFALVKPPFLDESGALEWANRSVDFAFDCGATVVSLIPTRLGNGALEALVARGEFSPPKLETLEAALEYGVGLNRGRVFADLWDLEKFSDCPECFERRRSRLRSMNLEQSVSPRAICKHCEKQSAPGHLPACPG